MSKWTSEWDNEQTRVARVTEALHKRIAEYEPLVGEIKSEVVDFRTHFWDDVTVNLSNDDDILETFMSMKQQAQVLSEREHSHRHTRRGANEGRGSCRGARVYAYCTRPGSRSGPRPTRCDVDDSRWLRGHTQPN